MRPLRTIRIPSNPHPRAYAPSPHYWCVVCGLPVAKPRFMVHVIDGGGKALHVDDELLYEPDGGDVGLHPIGSDCARRHLELKPYLHRA